MGADLDVDRTAGSVRTRGRELHGAAVTGEQLPGLIDEVPALAVAGALAASGSLDFQDAGELRTKESDRIETVGGMVRALGGEVTVGREQLVVRAMGPDGLRPGRVTSHHDHRIAMAGAVASIALHDGQVVEIDDWDCVATSYPGFLDDLERLTEV